MSQARPDRPFPFHVDPVLGHLRLAKQFPRQIEHICVPKSIVRASSRQSSESSALIAVSKAVAMASSLSPYHRQSRDPPFPRGR